MAKPAAPLPHEPSVLATDPMPKGYRFVPKGNVYITKHCRQQTHLARKTLYVVVNDTTKTNNKPIGLRCPSHIYHAVLAQHRATASRRAAAVRRRDEAHKEGFEAAVARLFPALPRAELPQIARHALKKRSRRVGRAGAMALADRARLAVRAHIRHVHTEYDALLKGGVGRAEARKQVREQVDEIARRWGGGGGSGPRPVVRKTSGKKSGKGRASAATMKSGAKSAKKAVVLPDLGDRAVGRRVGEEMLGFSQGDQASTPEKLGHAGHRRGRGLLNLSMRVDDQGSGVDERDADVDGTFEDVDDDDCVFSWDETSEYDSSCSERSK